MSNTEKILLDANAVINAALLPQSFTTRAVVLAKQVGHCRFLVSAGVMREVNKVLNEMSIDEAILIPAWERVNILLQWLPATFVTFVTDDDSSAAPGEIQKRDRHVYHAACRTGAAVLTADAGLWLGCRKYDVPTFLPLELIRRWDGIALQTMVFGVAPTPMAGSLFARCYPGAWAGGREGKFTIAHFPGGFWVYYSAAESCWVAEVEGLEQPLRVPGPVANSTLQTLCLSWQIVPKKPQIQLCVGGVEHPDTQPLKEPLGFRPSGNPMVGSYAENRYVWNGHIYFCITNDKSVGNKTWKKYQEHRDLAPNPYDADRVKAAVQALCATA
jgi:hypothetical protein